MMVHLIVGHCIFTCMHPQIPHRALSLSKINKIVCSTLARVCPHALFWHGHTRPSPSRSEEQPLCPRRELMVLNLHWLCVVCHPLAGLEAICMHQIPADSIHLSWYNGVEHRQVINTIPVVPLGNTTNTVHAEKWYPKKCTTALGFSRLKPTNGARGVWQRYLPYLQIKFWGYGAVRFGFQREQAPVWSNLPLWRYPRLLTRPFSLSTPLRCRRHFEFGLPRTSRWRRCLQLF